MEIEPELNENILNEQLASAYEKKDFFKAIINDLYDSEIIYQNEIKDITSKIITSETSKADLIKITIRNLIILIIFIYISQTLSPLFYIPALVFSVCNLPKTIKLARITKQNNIPSLYASVDFLADKLKTIGEKEKELKKIIKQTENLILEIEDQIKTSEGNKQNAINLNPNAIEENYPEVRLVRENPQNNLKII